MTADDPAPVQRPLSCGACAVVLEGHILYRPHRNTVRRWAVSWLEHGVDYLRLPGRVVIFPSGIEKILARLHQLDCQQTG